MKHLSLLMLLTTLCCGTMLAGRLCAADAPDDPPPKQGDGPDGANRPPRGGVHIIPPFAMKKLNLTDDQKKQIADLEKEVKTKLATILTADQMKTLESARPPRRGPEGDNGPGNDQNGPPGGGKGPGGQGGNGKGPPPEQ